MKTTILSAIAFIMSFAAQSQTSHELFPTTNQAANKTELIVSPNPANDKINFSGPCNVILMDILGKKVLQKNYTSSVNISLLKEGIYIIQLSDANGDIIQKAKLIIE